MSDGRLAGHKVLVVEDDYYLATDTQTWLERAGAVVLGPTPDASEAIRLLRDGKPDAALVDINLGKGPCFEVAGALSAQQVPFAFVTGYEASVIPASLKPVPRLEKPVSERATIAAVEKLVGAG
jgi:CheY-like chemotaxis protein